MANRAFSNRGALKGAGGCPHQLGQSTQNGQQVKASRDRVSASRRDTRAVLKPTAKGSDSINSSSSQLLSCHIHDMPPLSLA